MQKVFNAFSIVIFIVLICVLQVLNSAKHEIKRIKQQKIIKVEKQMSTLSTCVCWTDGEITRKTIITTTINSGETPAQHAARHKDEVTAFASTVDEVPCK